MTALNIGVLCPHRFHLFDVETFESAVKAFIGFGHFFFFVSHGQLVMRFWCDKNQRDEALPTAIENPMIRTGGRQRDFPCAQLALFVADLKYTVPFQHIVNFILPAVNRLSI